VKGGNPISNQQSPRTAPKNGVQRRSDHPWGYLRAASRRLERHSDCSFSAENPWERRAVAGGSALAAWYPLAHTEVTPGG
jgi:hypothetical protein